MQDIHREERAVDVFPLVAEFFRKLLVKSSGSLLCHPVDAA